MASKRESKTESSRKEEAQRKREERRQRRSERGGGSAKKVLQMQEEVKDDRDSDVVLDSTLRVAAEISDLGTQVAGALAEQTDQMLRMDRDLAEINASLQRSERILKGMQSWAASVAKNWTSFIPEKPKMFSITRADVSAQAREKEIKASLGADDDKDVFSVPKALVSDEGELAKLLKTAEDKKRFVRRPEEKLIYFYFNSANLKLLSLDVTANCILVTNRRIVKLEKGTEICSHDFIDIALVEREESPSTGRFEKLILTLRDGSREVVGIWNREVTTFLEKCLRKISQGNDINLDLIRKKKQDKGRDSIPDTEEKK